MGRVPDDWSPRKGGYRWALKGELGEAAPCRSSPGEEGHVARGVAGGSQTDHRTALGAPNQDKELQLEAESFVTIKKKSVHTVPLFRAFAAPLWFGRWRLWARTGSWAIVEVPQAPGSSSGSLPHFLRGRSRCARQPFTS